MRAELIISTGSMQLVLILHAARLEMGTHWMGRECTLREGEVPEAKGPYRDFQLV